MYMQWTTSWLRGRGKVELHLMHDLTSVKNLYDREALGGITEISSADADRLVAGVIESPDVWVCWCDPEPRG